MIRVEVLYSRKRVIGFKGAIWEENEIMFNLSPEATGTSESWAVAYEKKASISKTDLSKIIHHIDLADCVRRDIQKEINLLECRLEFAREILWIQW